VIEHETRDAQVFNAEWLARDVDCHGNPRALQLSLQCTAQ
jgi:hypothetical protein